jgi:hypothetical protein
VLVLCEVLQRQDGFLQVGDHRLTHTGAQGADGSHLNEGGLVRVGLVKEVVCGVWGC